MIKQTTIIHSVCDYEKSVEVSGVGFEVLVTGRGESSEAATEALKANLSEMIATASEMLEEGGQE